MMDKHFSIDQVWNKLSLRERRLIGILVVLLWSFILLKLIVIPSKIKSFAQKQKIHQVELDVEQYKDWIGKETAIMDQNKELKKLYDDTLGVIDHPISGNDIDSYLKQQNIGIVEERQYQEVREALNFDRNYYILPLSLLIKMPQSNIVKFEKEWLEKFPNSRVTELEIEKIEENWVYANLELSNYTTFAPPKQGFINQYKHAYEASDDKFEENASINQDVEIVEIQEKVNSKFPSDSNQSSSELNTEEDRKIFESSNIKALNGLITDVKHLDGSISFSYSPDTQKLEEVIFIKPLDTVELRSNDEVIISVTNEMMPGTFFLKVQELDGTIKDIRGECDGSDFRFLINKDLKIIGGFFCLETNHLRGGNYEISEK